MAVSPAPTTTSFSTGSNSHLTSGLFSPVNFTLYFLRLLTENTLRVTFGVLEFVLLFIAVSYKSHVLAKGPINRNTCKAHGEYKAAHCDVQIGRSFHVLAFRGFISLVYYGTLLGGEVKKGSFEESRRRYAENPGEHLSLVVIIKGLGA